MTSSSNGNSDDRRPDSAEWGAINQVSQTSKPQASASRQPTRPPADPEILNAPPGDPGTIDLRPGSYRNYGGPLIVIAFLGIALGVGYVTFKEDKVDLNQRPTIHFSGSTLQQAGQVPENIKAAPPPPRRTVRIDSVPAGARVMINEHAVDGLTPLEASVVAEEPVNLRIVLKGHKRFDAQITPGQTRVNATLAESPKPALKEQKSAVLEVTSAPAGARVLVEGAEVGVTPLGATTLANVGPVAIRVIKAGHNPHTVITTLLPGRSRNIGVKLTPENKERRAIQIRVESNPNGATIERVFSGRQSKRLGKTGYNPLLITGRVGETITLRASAAGHLPSVRKFDVHASDYTVQLELPPPVQTFGKLSVKGPKDLMVFLDSDELDALPLKAQKLKSGQHRLVAVDQKTRKRASLTFSVSENAELRLEIERTDEALTIKNLTKP